MPRPIVFLTHTGADRCVYYPAPALTALREMADVRLNTSTTPLQGEALAKAAAGAQIIVSDRQTPGEAVLFAASPQLVAFVHGSVDIQTIDVPAASEAGVLITRVSPGLVTPHIGGATPAAVLHQAMETTRQVADILHGRVPEGAVNAEAAVRLRRFTPPLTPELGGVEGPEPTRYGDWQHKGRVSDF
jgi:hypothetical protein